MATPAWVRNHRRAEHITARLIREHQTDQAILANIDIPDLDDDVTAVDGTIVRRTGMTFSEP